MKRADLVPGDVILVRGKDFISREIEQITHSTYSHVAMVVSGGTLIEAQGFARVRYRDLTAYTGLADVYRPVGIPYQKRLQIVTNAQQHLGQHYDYGLIGVELVRYALGVTLPWYEHKVVICSTLIAIAARQEGYDPCPGIAHPSPADFPLSKLYTLQGSI